jgi:hypothetical protein
VAVEGLTKRRILISFVRQALRAQSAFSVRGSSRRITSMRFRPANTIDVCINNAIIGVGRSACPDKGTSTSR